jgi:hypothetical protein
MTACRATAGPNRTERRSHLPVRRDGFGRELRVPTCIRIREGPHSQHPPSGHPLDAFFYFSNGGETDNPRGAEEGSQQGASPSDTEPQSAAIDAGDRTYQPTSGDMLRTLELHGMQKVRGSNPLSSTTFSNRRSTTSD